VYSLKNYLHDLWEFLSKRSLASRGVILILKKKRREECREEKRRNRISDQVKVGRVSEKNPKNARNPENSSRRPTTKKRRHLFP
jgi:hypothetical protein